MFFINKEICEYHQKRNTWKKIHCQLCKSTPDKCKQFPELFPEDERRSLRDYEPAQEGYVPDKCDTGAC